MMHNQPWPLEKVVTDRKFDDILKSTYSHLDSLETQLRKCIAGSIKRFAVDPANAVQWTTESAVANQTELTLVIEIRTLINAAETLEAVPENFDRFIAQYHKWIVGWAQYEENSSGSMMNIASRITLAATAKAFGSFDLAEEVKRHIERDIEESNKRVVVSHFGDLAVDDFFRVSPDTNSQLYRKLSPRKGTKAVYPANKAAQQRFSPQDTAYVFRVPLESDVLYEELVAA